MSLRWYRHTWGTAGRRTISLGRLLVVLSEHRFSAFATAHGPRQLPWWRPIAIKIHKCDRPTPDCNPHRWNVWVYSRWGTWCNFVAWRRPA